MPQLRNKQLEYPLSGSFTGSLLGTASYADYSTTSSFGVSSSYSLSSSYSNVSISASYSQTASYAPDYLLISQTGSMTVLSASYASSSLSSSYSQTSSYSISASYSEFSVSSSYSATASYFKEVDPVFVAKSASLATTGSNTFYGNQIISGSQDFILEVHSVNQAPWIFGMYNDTYSKTQSVLAGWIDDTGSAYIGTEVDKPLLIYTSGVDNNYTPTLIISSSGVTVDNTLTVNNGITGSLFGTASYADYTTSSSYTDTASFAISSSQSVSSSYAISSSFSGTSISASYAKTASFAPTYLPLTGGTINGDVILNGTASIAFLNVTYESASVIYSSGSNQFGDAADDVQTLYGAVNIPTGSLTVSGRTTITGSLNVTGGITGSLLGTATTASYVTASNVYGPYGSNSVVSASYSISSSQAQNATTSSYSLTASYVANASSFPFTGSAIITGSLTVTGSIISTDGFTGSLFGTASYASSASYATTSSYSISSSYAMSASSVISSSYALSSSYAISSSNTISASYALSSSYAITASYANNAGTASYASSTTQMTVYVINQSGNTINKGLVVRIDDVGNSSDIPRVVTASYENDNNSANTLGITIQNITNGSTGYVITEGILTGVDTSAFAAGQLIYLGANGSITGSAPRAPLHAVRLGEVVKSNVGAGIIYVRIDNGYEIGELHDVLDNTTTSSYGDLLIKSGSVWTNSKTLSGSYVLSGSLTTNDGVLVQTLTASVVSASSFTGSLFGTASYALSAQGIQGSVQFRGANPGDLAASALSGYFTWLETNNNAGNKRSGSLNIGPPVPNGQSLSNNPLSISHNINEYAQMNMQNLNAGYAASSDIIATADNGTDTNYYVDLGINSSTYNQAAYNIGGPNDSYLVNVGGNLTIGTDSAKDLILHTNGSTTASERMRITSAGAIRMTGSVLISGSFILTGSLTTNDGVNVQTITASVISASSLTGSLFGTASWASQATTASYILNAVSSSYSLSSSYAVSSSYSLSSSFATTSSYVLNAVSSSFASTASFVTASNVYGPFGSNSIISSSYALTASYALTSAGGGSGAGFPFTGSAVITGSLIVTGSGTFTDSVLFDTVLMTSSLVSTGAGTTTISTQATGSYRSMFAKYTVSNTGNARAGEFMAVWNGANIQFTDYSTIDIGSTATLVFTGSLSGNNVLLTTAPGSGWTVKVQTTYV